MTADKRSQTVQQNLDNALVAAKDRTPASVNITYVKGVPVITLGGYQVVTVDSASAKAMHSTPALLAKKWGDAIRDSLKDQASVATYVAQLSGDYASNAPAPQATPVQAAPQQAQNNYPPQGQIGGVQTSYQQPVNYTTQPNYPPPGYGQPPGGGQYAPPQGGYRQGRVSYAPAGMTMNATLSTGISTTVARPGDMIQASLSQPLVLGDATIPAGSFLEGTVTDASGGKLLGRAGTLGIKFNRLRTPDGVETPISAHLVGGIGKYSNANGSDVMKGETWKTKVGQGAIRTGIGAGAGAALGTAVGAIAGGGHGAGTGAWSGTAIGAGVGMADSLLLRKGKDVNIAAGTPLEIQLDQAATFTGGSGPATASQGNYGY
ncbi:MAG: hypothetical protein KGS72_05980 [Cyanobacteria bacterium REEB67]|nr:hypothetical protein [Cyanobacteria bacterium REEB67]